MDNLLADLLPMPPWQGPPLPRFLGIAWPWLQSTSQSLLPLLPRKYITSVEERTEIVPYQAPLATYNNEETWDIEWNEETGLPTRITVHRHANRS